MPININEIISRPGAERGVLSIILNNNDRILECEQQELFADHFSVPGHQYIYTAICHLYSNPDAHNIDSLAIYNTIVDQQARETVDNLGGMQYIDSLIQGRIADNLRLYITQVRECAIKRMAYQMGTEIQSIVMRSDNTPIEEVLEAIQQRTLDLVLQNEEQNEIYHMGDSLEERLRLRAEHPESIPGYVMGWAKYDRMTQGYKGNELTVLVAPSKTGKSAWLLNHGRKFSVDDSIPGLYIDTEMNDVEQEDRLISMLTAIPYEEIYNGMFARDTMYGTAEGKRARINAAIQKIRQSNLYHIYMPNFTIEKVTALVRKYQIQHNIGYVIFDYIKLPTSEIAGLASAQEYQRLGFITTCLKDLAGICDIPIITAAQSNRTNIDGYMDESSIGGSYRILQMATRLVFLRNKTNPELNSEGYASGNQKLRVAFQRNGVSSNEEINFMFDKSTLNMREIV